MDGLKTIFARNCSVARIGKAACDAFLQENHRLGSTGGRYRYALFVERSTGASEDAGPGEGAMVAVALFSNARRWKKDGGVVSSYEWIRYCSLRGYRVVGGMSRVLRHFIAEVGPDDIMSYADADYPDGGDVYATLGFVAEGEVVRGGHRNIKYRLVLHR